MIIDLTTDSSDPIPPPDEFPSSALQAVVDRDVKSVEVRFRGCESTYEFATIESFIEYLAPRIPCELVDRCSAIVWSFGTLLLDLERAVATKTPSPQEILYERRIRDDRTAYDPYMVFVEDQRRG